MHIIYEGADGSVAISTIAPGYEDNIDEIVRKFREVHPDGAYPKFMVVEKVDAPENRQFRDAWVKQGNKVVVDKSKAKKIHLDRIRAVRNEKLAELDKEQLRHLTDNWKVQDIEKEKQILRDLPATIVEFDVNAPVWPSELS